ncbi:MAG: septum formation initiator family protein [Prevotellaceae bacterium]|jgi:cell division protein FtsB|nr:septum formation initiator family protein [Prevotellaceae bacterium]
MAKNKHFFLSRYGFITIIAGFLVWLTFFDKRKFVDFSKDKTEGKWELLIQNSKLNTENAQNRKKIADLQQEIKLFKTDTSYIEEYARETYKMSKGNEDVFLFNE